MMKFYRQINNNNRVFYKAKSICVATLLTLCCTAIQVSAQLSDTIGFGVTSANSYGPVRMATSTAGSFSIKVIHLYTQSDLAQIGIFPGAVISSLAWQKSTIGTLINGSSVTINVSMRSNVSGFTYGSGVSSTILIDNYIGSNFAFAGSKTFSANGTNLPADTFWVPVEFSAPYTYQGGGLEVLVNSAVTNGTGNPASALINWRLTNGTMYKSIYTNSPAAYNNTANCNLGTMRPNTIFTYTPGPACTGTPTTGTISMETTEACPGMLAGHLSLKNASTSTGIKIQWEKKDAGQSSFTAMPGETGYELFNQEVTAITEYRAVLTCGTSKSTSGVITMVPTPSILPPWKEDFETNGTWFSLTIPGCMQTRRGILADPVDFLKTTSNNTGYTYGSWTSDGWNNSGTWGAARLTASTSS